MSTTQHETFSIGDERGRQIGTVRLIHLGRNGRNGRPFWEARALDGCDLGAHAKRIDAEWAIQDDNDAGRPRDPDAPRERFRPVLGRGTDPLYLGPVGAVDLHEVAGKSHAIPRRQSSAASEFPFDQLGSSSERT